MHETYHISISINKNQYFVKNKLRLPNKLRNREEYVYVFVCIFNMYIHIKKYILTQTPPPQIDTTKEYIFYRSFHTWTVAKLIIDNMLDWQIKKK